MEVVLNSQAFLLKTSYNWEKTLRYLSVWNIEDKMIGNFWITSTYPCYSCYSR